MKARVSFAERATEIPAPMERDRNPSPANDPKEAVRLNDSPVSVHPTPEVRPAQGALPGARAPAGRSLTPPQAGEAEARRLEEVEWEEVRVFAYNVWKMEVANKSMSQFAILLVRTVHHCPGLVGQHSQRLLAAAISKQRDGDEMARPFAAPCS